MSDNLSKRYDLTLSFRDRSTLRTILVDYVYDIRRKVSAFPSVDFSYLTEDADHMEALIYLLDVGGVLVDESD